MTNIATSVKDPNKLKRITTIKPPPKKELVKKIDYDSIVKAWTIQTNILERIKKNDPDKPFYVDMTPQMAMDILTINDVDQNRIIDWSVVDIYADQMKRKKWKEKNGDTICVSKTMQLLDGQHRLWAIYLSGETIIVSLVTGLEDDVFAFKDIGRKRNAADIVHINGLGANSGQIGQTIKAIILYKKKSIVKGTANDRDVLNHEVNEFVRNKTEMNKIVKALGRAKVYWMSFNANYFTAPQWAFVFYTLQGLPGMQDQAVEFIERFADCNNLKATSPIKVVRNYFENDFKHLAKQNKKNRTNKASIHTKVKHLFEAWNLWIRGEKVSEIKVDLLEAVIAKPIYNKSN